MGQGLHRSATTTEAIRRAIQQSQESMRALARRPGINPKTVRGQSLLVRGHRPKLEVRGA